MFVYRTSDQERDLTELHVDSALSAGAHRIEVSIQPRTGTPGGEILLSVDGQAPARMPFERYGRFMGGPFVGRHANLDLIDGAAYLTDFLPPIQSVEFDIPGARLTRQPSPWVLRIR